MLPVRVIGLLAEDLLHQGDEPIGVLTTPTVPEVLKTGKAHDPAPFRTSALLLR
jgi:hypothetical protein